MGDFKRRVESHGRLRCGWSLEVIWTLDGGRVKGDEIQFRRKFFLDGLVVDTL